MNNKKSKYDEVENKYKKTEGAIAAEKELDMIKLLDKNVLSINESIERAKSFCEKITSSINDSNKSVGDNTSKQENGIVKIDELWSNLKIAINKAIEHKNKCSIKIESIENIKYRILLRDLYINQKNATLVRKNMSYQEAQFYRIKNIALDEYSKKMIANDSK